MKRQLWIFLLVSLGVVLPLRAEVVIFAEPATGIVVQGPLSIIEDPDPVPNYWIGSSPAVSGRYVLNPQGATNGDGRPATGRTPSGLPIVVWGKNNGNGFDLVYSVFDNGAWSAEATLAAAVSPDVDPEPAMAFDRMSGAVHVVYSTGGSAPSIFAIEAPSDLSSWTAPALVSQVAEIALRPSAVVHEGQLRVAYESHGSGVGSTPRQIVVATEISGSFNHQAVSSTHHGGANRPQLHTGVGDRLWLDWIDASGDVAWTVWSSGDVWSAVTLETYSDDADREFHVRRRVRQLAAAN